MQNMSSAWKSNETAVTPFNSAAEPVRPMFGNSVHDATGRAAGDQASIGKGLVFSGEITGAESLFIDGKVEGSINLPGSRVTVGRNGKVAASISAREVIILGKVRGNVTASDRVEIRAEGAVTGDVKAGKICIEDGAFFKGGIDVRKPEVSAMASTVTTTDVLRLVPA